MDSIKTASISAAFSSLRIVSIPLTVRIGSAPASRITPTTLWRQSSLPTATKTLGLFIAIGSARSALANTSTTSALALDIWELGILRRAKAAAISTLRSP